MKWRWIFAPPGNKRVKTCQAALARGQDMGTVLSSLCGESRRVDRSFRTPKTVPVSLGSGERIRGCRRKSRHVPEECLRRLRRGMGAAVLALAGSFVITGIITGKPTYFGVRPFLVVSESMEPTLRVGQVVLAVPVETEDLKVGDVVVYRQSLIEKDDTTIMENPAPQIQEREKQEDENQDNETGVKGQIQNQASAFSIQNRRTKDKKKDFRRSENSNKSYGRRFNLCKNTIHRIKALKRNGTAVLRGDNNFRDDDAIVSTSIRYKVIM